MGESGLAVILAPLLAAIGGAGAIFALFYPLLFRPSFSGRRNTAFEVLLRGAASASPAATRAAKRAQETALKSVAQQKSAARAPLIESQLAAAGLNWTVRRYVTASLAIGFGVFCAAVSAGLAPALAFACAGLAAWLPPQRYLAMRANRRRRTFLSAFAPAVDMIVRGAKAGLSVMDCLGLVASDAEEPVRSEFEAILAQLKAGLPLSAALDKLAAAMPAPEVRFFTLVMSMQSQTGGNLTEALGNLSAVLRDRERIASKVRIASSEARASAVIIGALPFAVIAATAALAPDYVAIFWRDETGRAIALFCAVWLFTGILAIRWMARIEV